MSVNSGLFTSDSPEWVTPRDLFDKIAVEFGPFDLDPCCTQENAKAPRFFTRESDGLAQPWAGRVFVNPPYGRVIGQWVKKSYLERERAEAIVMLIPARTDTAWWHDYVQDKAEVRFLRGRVKFENGGKTGSAPFPSCLAIYRPTGSASHHNGGGLP